MTALFVTATWPDPLDRFTHGVAQRMRLLLRGMAAVDPVLDVLAYAPWHTPPRPGAAEQLRSDFESIWGVKVRQVFVAESEPVPDRLNEVLRGYVLPAWSLRRQPTYARLSGARQAQAFAMALRKSDPRRILVHKLAALCPLMRSRGALPPVDMDLDDIEHRTFERLIAMPPHWRTKRLMKLWLPALERGERAAVARVRSALVCSTGDRDYLRSRWGADNVAVVPNALPVPPVSPLTRNKTALFLGMHSYAPNRIGAEYLIERIWPRVLQRHPDAMLTIAGRSAEQIRGFDRPPPGVHFRGYVEDLDQLYAETRVVCCPILSGGGTRIKIIEGALRARPVVSTTLGAEGLDLSPQAGEIAIADDDAAFAGAIASLFEDHGAAERLAERGYQCARDRYGEDRVLQTLVKHLHSVELGQ